MSCLVHCDFRQTFIFKQSAYSRSLQISWHDKNPTVYMKVANNGWKTWSKIGKSFEFCRLNFTTKRENDDIELLTLRIQKDNEVQTAFLRVAPQDALRTFFRTLAAFNCSNWKTFLLSMQSWARQFKVFISQE